MSDSYSFFNTGVDYCGPLYVRDIYSSDNISHKAWIALFTCALYLELVPSHNAKYFINCFRRFISNRGALELIISGNGSNFTASEVQRLAVSRNIKWQFNVPVAPWWGGFFESLVRLVKRCLRKTLGGARLNFDEMRTVLTEVQNILNNRPLTYVYSDELEVPLTPNRLLFGRNLPQTLIPQSMIVM